MHRLIATAVISATLLSAMSFDIAAQSGNSSFPEVKQKGKTAIVAHRGFWKCEAAGHSENSIAALKAAQDNKCWGSECDVHITVDDIVIVNHNNDIKGKLIWDHKYSDFDSDLLPNGEKRPTIEQYLDQLAKSKSTVLVIEFKIQKSDEREDLLIEKTVEALKAKGLYDPKRVAFISFSRHACRKIAADYPEFTNQYLSGKIAPEVLESEGINGLDYHYSNFKSHPEFVADAHSRGMSVNAWTVDDKANIQKMIDLGVDQITTNEPLVVRELLGKKEFKK